MQGEYSPFQKLSPPPDAMQAQPVHHVGGGTPENPEAGSSQQKWLELKGRAENMLRVHPAGSPQHDEVLRSYNKILEHLGGQQYQHERLDAGMGPADLESSFQELQRDPQSMRSFKGELPPQLPRGPRR